MSVEEESASSIGRCTVPVMMTGANMSTDRWRYQHARRTEREEIFCALVEDPTMGWAVIGRRVGRHRSTVAREVAAGGGRERYRPAAAQRRADRQRRRSRARRLAVPGPLRDRISGDLRLGRSPEAIRADLVTEGVPQAPCTETIYQAIYTGALEVRPSECLRTRRRRRRCREGRNPRSAPCGPNIAARPAAVNERAEAGHWEVDQIIGAYNRSSMIWLTERQSRYLIPVTMPDGYDADAVLAGLIEGLDTVPAHLRRSLTFDCGSEWANWRRLAGHYDLQVWFCDPHSPWHAARSRTRTAKCAGGSHGAPTCDLSPPPKPNTPPTSSTTNAAAASTTKAQQNSMLPSPCSDH